MSLFPDTQPSSGGTGSDWSYFPAVSSVNLAGHPITNGSATLTNATITDLTVSTINGSAPNSGIMALNQGPGISLYGTDPQRPGIANTGVLTVSAGAGIGISGTSQTPTILNTGILNFGTGGGIINTGSAQSPVISTQVQTISAGANIYITGDEFHPIINALPQGTYNIQPMVVLEANLSLGSGDKNKMWVYRAGAGSSWTVTLPNPLPPQYPGGIGLTAGDFYTICCHTQSFASIAVLEYNSGLTVTLAPGQSMTFVATQGTTGTVSSYTRIS